MQEEEIQSLVQTIRGWETGDEEAEHLFTRERWSLDTAEAAFAGLVLDRSFHLFSVCEEGLPVEVVQRRLVAHWYAERDGYIALGLHLIALVLSDIPCLTVTLSHRESRIGRIHFLKRPPMRVSPSLTHEPVRFTSYLYIPEGIDGVRLWCADPSLGEPSAQEPLFTAFSWADETQNSEQATLPDSLVIAATPQRMADFGAFLIDFGRNENAVDEMTMESVLDGCGGVSHGSVEQKFWLPGSLGFPEHRLDDISLP